MAARPVIATDTAGRLRRAVAALQAGQREEARNLARALLAEAGQPAQERNGLGSLLMRLGEPALAVQAFSDTRLLDSANLEYGINHAIALTAADRGAAALAVLAAYEKAGKAVPRYWSVRANAARSRPW